MRFASKAAESSSLGMDSPLIGAILSLPKTMTSLNDARPSVVRVLVGRYVSAASTSCELSSSKKIQNCQN